MNINKEKMYIYEMMQNVILERRIIAEERLRLSELYFSLKERLEKLEDLELKGLDNLSLKGYVDLKNEFDETSSLQNLKREMENLKNQIEEVRSKRIEDEDNPKLELNPNISEFEISEQRFRDNIQNNIVIKKNKKEEDVTEKKAKRNRRDREHTRKIYSILLEELKNRAGEVVGATDMYEVMNGHQIFRDAGMPLKEFRSNVFYRVAKLHEDKIIKVDTGRYKYLEEVNV